MARTSTIRPVPDIDGLSAVFGSIEHIPRYEDVEERFKNHNDPHCKFISKWFFVGLTDKEITRIKPRESVDQKAALRAIVAAMRSWEPKHEHKEAGCAQLLHDWFVLDEKDAA